MENEVQNLMEHVSEIAKNAPISIQLEGWPAAVTCVSFAFATVLCVRTWAVCR